MEGHSEAEIKKHVNTYLVIFGVLLFFTALTVAANYLHLPVKQAIALALCIATIKASLVALFFMHLISERKLIYAALLLTAVFFVALMLLPVGQVLDAVVG